MIRQAVVPLALLSVVAPVFGQQTVEGSVQDASGNARVPVTLKSANAAPAEAKVAGMAKSWDGSVKFGEHEFAFVVGQTEGAELPDVLRIDLDGNGSMGDDEQFALKCSTRGEGPRQMTIGQPVEFDLSIAGRATPAMARFVVFGGRPRLTVQLRQYFVAETEIGGTPCKIAIVDDDLDGTFGSAEDLWGIPTGPRPLSSYSMNAMTDKPLHDGHLVQVTVQGHEVTVTTTASDVPDAATEAAKRVRAEHIWAKRFDAEREDFLKRQDIDTSRTKSEAPIDWHYVTYDEALAMGKKAGKPVFIDVMAFWCVWCYRMDYYTYPDAEVAQLLSEKFIPVKIIQEQDRAGDYDKVMKEKLEARGIPAMGIFDADGNVLHKIGGWKKPAAFVTELRDALNKAGS